MGNDFVVITRSIGWSVRGITLLPGRRRSSRSPAHFVHTIDYMSGISLMLSLEMATGLIQSVDMSYTARPLLCARAQSNL